MTYNFSLCFYTLFQSFRAQSIVGKYTVAIFFLTVDCRSSFSEALVSSTGQVRLFGEQVTTFKSNPDIPVFEAKGNFVKRLKKRNRNNYKEMFDQDFIAN